MVYGYIRVSARDQNIERQWEALQAFPVPIRNIYIDRQSGKSFDRPQYLQLLTLLQKGDLVVVHSIDRLGRNYDEILEQWRTITRDKQADILVLDFPLLDTREKLGVDNRLTGRFLSDLVLQILAYVAQQERENIHRRQAEGIACAQAHGVHFGPPTAELPANFEKLYLRWQAGALPTKELLRRCKMTRSTFYRRVRQRQQPPAVGD